MKQHNENIVFYKRMWLYVNDRCGYKKLDDSELRSVLRMGGILVRNIYDFDTPKPTSFWYIIKDRFGGMEELAPKTRWMVRRALKTLDIRRLSKEELVVSGAWEVYCKALGHYKVQEGTVQDKDSYERSLLKLGERSECWAAFDREKGRLAAFAVNDVGENSCGYASIKADPDYLKWYYPIYGLIYEMNRYYLGEQKLQYVSDGVRSATEHSNIQPWLEEKFGFRKAFCRLQIRYVWWIGLAVNMLYPFRNMIKNRKMTTLLRMEEMRRGAI